ncbi:HPr(Ser) kinase/phosphatase [candidate division KSB1 bacterium]
MNTNQKLTVEILLKENKQLLSLRLLNTKSGLKKVIHEPDLCRPGLLLAGFTKTFSYKKIQVFGRTELAYLEQLGKEERIEAFTRMLKSNIPCLVVANKGKIDKELLQSANDANTCIIQSPFPTIQIYQALFEYLNDKVAPWTAVHGTLVDVYGIGILFTGKSGIGKSEIALDLVERGHRLVADDVVKIFRKSAGVIVGTSEAMLKNMLEIRGVGLIDVWSIFGIRAIRVQKRVEVEVQLEQEKELEEYDRLGITTELKQYLGVEIPVIHLPILPGKNITVISEVIALKAMQRVYGIQPEQEFIKRLDKKIKENVYLRKYLTRDLE